MDYSSILSKPKSFFGKQKVWMARGEDLALFNTHRPNIQNLLRHSCIPESSHNLWIGLYRVGTTEDEAKTFVVVSCTDRRIRKLTRDILSSCPIFQPGQALDRFKVISKATLPETVCEPRPTMQDEQELEYGEPGLLRRDECKNIAKDEYKTIRISPSITGDSYLCRQVQACQVSGKGEVRFQTATAGPLISLDGRTYQLTVAHLVNFQEKDMNDATESTTDNWDDWDDESDDDTDSSCSVDEDVASWDISSDEDGAPASDVSDDEVPESLSSNSALEVATQQNESVTAITEATSPDEETINTSVHPPSSPFFHLSERPVLEEFLIDHASSYLGFAPAPENCRISKEMDYLLVPTAFDPQTQASKGAEIVQISEAFDITTQTDPRPVIIAAASLGYTGGLLFPAPSLLRSPGSNDFQALYCIESHNAMPKGTSGSAVFDKRTGFLAGHIVLGCPEKKICYMIPIVNVLNDLEVHFRLKAKCQIRLDAIAAERWVFSFDTPGVGQRRLHESSQGLLDSTLTPKSEESHLRMFSDLRRGTRWGPVSITIPSILKEFLSEKPARSDQWRNQFGYNDSSPESDRRLFASFKDLRFTLLEPMAHILPGGPNEKRQVMAGKYRRDVPQAQAWMLEIFEPFIRGADALDRPGLLELLKRKDLLHDSDDSLTYTPQCLHIKNIDPSTAMTLYKPTSWRPIKGCRALFATNASYQPNPVIDILQDVWQGSACFNITINLPFLVITTENELFKTFIAGRSAFRTPFDLSFLQIPAQSCDTHDEGMTFQTEKSYLFLTTWSTMIIGTSERYWTAVCLDDDFGERLTADDASQDKGISPGSSEGQTITVKKSMPPRAYALRVLAIRLDKVARHHRKITLVLDFNLNIFVRFQNLPQFYGSYVADFLSQEEKVNGPNTDELLKHDAWRSQFRRCVSNVSNFNSKVITTIESLLLTDLQVTPDGQSGRPLWQGFYQDPGASKSSLRIQMSLDMLRDVQNQLLSMHSRIDVRPTPLTLDPPADFSD
ncbi:hypothetical protein FDENT_11869 [Fusarium denticulatum]|uniref:Uncharacterized protein n=1 Tax=Fusarium denticulatum TaxID=48507 RepID=A0A8H5WS31_9HYPO|nr:hypothetical protein FDENT_11869 [Fusarium denticulatum]